MGTTADGMVPDLMAGDFRHGREGRAKTADFLSQLFARDPARARNLRAKARGIMDADERRRLDRLIEQARLVDEDDSTPEDPGQDDPEEPEPDKEKCRQLSQALKVAEADLRGAESLHNGAQKAVNEKTDEVDQKYSAYEKALAAFAIEKGIALWEISKGRIPRGVSLPSEVSRLKEAYETASRELKVLIDELHRARDQLKQARKRVSELHGQIEAAGCGN